jgi:hypothetical protein
MKNQPSAVSPQQNLQPISRDVARRELFLTADG